MRWSSYSTLRRNALIEIQSHSSQIKLRAPMF